MDNETLLAIAQEYGTPTYVYDMDKIREQSNKLKGCFTYPNTKFLYALKANYNPHIVREIIRQNFGIDAVSPEEVVLGLKLGANQNSVIFTGNNMSNEDMTAVHNSGVLLNIDSLSRLEKFGQAYPSSDVCVRFNPDVGDGIHEHDITGGPNSKFGVPYQQIKEVLDIVEKYNLRLRGIHQHIGSGWLNLESPLKALGIILEIASQIKGLDFIDLGGGFGIPYKPEEKELDIAVLAKKINERFTEFSQQYGNEVGLIIEPGRYIVAQAGHLLAEVTALKETFYGKRIVGINSGMNHMIRTALYGAYHKIINLSNPAGDLLSYDVCGNVCESSDFFARDRRLPFVREGDILSIEDTGAYGFAMSSDYQLRAKPAEVIVDGDRIFLSRRRGSINDFLPKYQIQD